MFCLYGLYQAADNTNTQLDDICRTPRQPLRIKVDRCRIRLMKDGSVPSGRFIAATAFLLLASCDRSTAPPPGPAANPRAPVATLVLEHSKDTLILREALLAHAVLHDSAGNLLIGRAVTWATSDSSRAVVLSGGWVYATGLGRVVIHAQSEGRRDSTVIVIVPRIIVRRMFPSLFAGDTTQLYATATDFYGAPLTFALTWMSGDTSIATVSGTGVVTATRLGIVRIAAAGASVSGWQDVAVLAPVLRPNRELTYIREIPRFDGHDVSSLWRLSLDGTTEIRLTPDSETVSSYAWAPDGSRLALGHLALQGIGRRGLYLTEPDGTAPVRVRSSAVVGPPLWSPDGLRLLALADTVPPYLVISDVAVASWGRVGASADFAQWSPDGRLIAFVRNQNNNGIVGILRPDGSNSLQIPVAGPVADLRWSPDGKRLAVRIGAALVIMNADGSNAQPFCPASIGCITPWSWDWSPDGGRLVLATSGRVHIVGRDGSHIATIVAGFAGSGMNPVPRWSPDGSLIAYVVEEPSNLKAVWLVGADGQGARELRPATLNLGAITWRP